MVGLAVYWVAIAVLQGKMPSGGAENACAGENAVTISWNDRGWGWLDDLGLALGKPSPGKQGL